MRALVVDDSNTMLIMLRHLLGGMGMEVHCCSGGPEALEYLASDTIVDLLVLDWNMPDVTGLDLVKAARGRERYKSSKIIMVTSETDAGLMQHALDAGADSYLMKPVNKENLEQKLGLIGISALDGSHDH